MEDFAAADSLAGQAMLDRIVQCIRTIVEPELVVLFGSRSQGEAREESDYDLMVVLDAGGTPDAERRALCARFHNEGMPVDVLVRTCAEYERNQRDPGFLDFIVARQGQVLFSTGRVPQRTSEDARVREIPPREGLEMWISRAESDFEIAEQSMASPRPVWDAICFHAHACAEKYLKAMIVRAGNFPPRTHQLLDLLDMQAAEFRENASIIAACTRLMDLLPNARYPEKPIPTPSETREALAAARHMREVLANELSRGS